MTRRDSRVRLGLAAIAALVAGSAAPAQDMAAGLPTPNVTALTEHVGMMVAGMPTPFGEGYDPASMTTSLRFEPITMLDDLFRTDVVFLMRHGPTDWSMADADGVAPGDCARQRLMTETGKTEMSELAIHLASNGILPGRIVVSPWCRNQETLAAMTQGFRAVDRAWADGLDIETDQNLALLLSLGGAANVAAMRETIGSWTGEGADGPLLLISHFTNIAELTEFHVYEGEILVLDPRLDGRVLGYLRLDTAAPDVGHFPNATDAAVRN
jgi:phosphohistidine phosphatase SixA